MRKGARSLVRQSRPAIALALLTCLGPFTVAPARAQLGPVDHDGYLEYQYRLSRSEEGPSNELHLGTWRTQASTWVWQPYILQLDGTLGLTRTRNLATDTANKGSIVTGSVGANVFARSRFPFRAFFESRDNRVDGDVFDTDLVSRNWGFLQQFSPRGGGRLAVDYRRSNSEQLHVDGLTARQKFGSEVWQVNGAKSLGRNDFRLMTSIRDLSREGPTQTQNRKIVNLRHRFRTSPRFFIEDTTFYSNERIQLDGTETHRRFLQFNGNSTWRPATKKPLMVIARALAQGVDSGTNGFERGSNIYLLTATASYQYSPQLTFAGNVGFNNNDPDLGPDQSSVNQRARATYRALGLDLGKMHYTWGGSLDVGNRRARTNGNDTVQDLAGNFNHGLSRIAILPSGRQFQISFTQTVAAFADTDDRREQSLVHTAFATLSRQNGRTSSYMRFAASDRRLFGDQSDVYQLLTLQAASRMQINRHRSLNGGVTLQYNNTSTTDMWNQEDRNRKSYTYSLDLSYMERDLFKVKNLNFLSELRLLSSDFRSDDIFDQGLETDPDRDDGVWRNELDYRIGLLEFRLLADVREANNRWMSQIFFTVRRYYGTL